MGAEYLNDNAGNFISEADGSEVYDVLDKIENAAKAAYNFLIENPNIILTLLIIIIIKSIITAIYGLYKSKKGKRITEVYDVVGEKNTYSKQYISFVRPIIELIILVLFIKVAYF